MGPVRIKLVKLFALTSATLILFAASLVAHDIHELQEAGIVPSIIEHLWDINPSLTTEGNYPLLHKNGYIGSIFKDL